MGTSTTDMKNEISITVTNTRRATAESVDFWSRAKSIEFAQLLSVHRCLWDPNCDNYRKKNAKLNAYESIGLALGYDSREIERKAKNVFSQYYRELKRNGKTATGNEAKSRKMWFLYEHLPFLAETPYAGRFINNLSLSNNEMIEQLIETNSQNSTDYNSTYNSTTSETITVEEKQFDLLTDRKRQMKSKKADALPVKVVKKVDSLELDEQGDEIDIFCKLVASKLRSLRIDIRVTAEIEITQLLCQKQIENLRPPDE